MIKIRTSIKPGNPTFGKAYCQIKSELLQMNRYLVQLDFISFIKFNSLSFCCANTLFSPFNALFTFESSGIGRALLALFLAPFAGLLLGAVFGILAYPLYRFLTSHSEFLAALSGRFQEISDETPEESLPDK
ncbi:hypothetical protein [Nitrosospira multiformis]|uniref:Uncharacterized protein n=1 Tax=Nitrosospira multiformis (strain ATCC 25196 / NCIMB 11849 / C 71) TaxID=323848 RepID=Q2Y779_NITMU|nr:hypothetical protein [Nitrosospira multiformis]ABB75392.1 hypothetical protein Nmul_A2099 [Nitrosospira multiformis ATCC 25196]